MVQANWKYLVEDESRHGTIRWYVRRKGQKKIRIWYDFEHPEFLSAYQAALEGRQLQKPSEKGPRQKVALALPDTFRALCEEYLSSTRFKADNNPVRQRTVRGILNHCCQEPIERGQPYLMGDAKVAVFGPRHVIVIRDRKADKPAAANNRVKEIRRVFNWKQEENPEKDIPNPAQKVLLLNRKVKGFHSWSLEEVARYEARYPLGTSARLALDLLLYTAARRGDMVKLGRQHISGEGWLHFEVGKTGVEIDMPIIEPLAESIAAFIRARRERGKSTVSQLTFLVTEYGKPFTPDGMGMRFRKWCDDAGLPNCSAHGLRKATAARLAELGCSEEEIAAITGHLDPDQIRIYTRAARRRLMAENAMRKLEGGLKVRAKKSMTKLAKILNI